MGADAGKRLTQKVYGYLVKVYIYIEFVMVFLRTCYYNLYI